MIFLCVLLPNDLVATWFLPYQTTIHRQKPILPCCWWFPNSVPSVFICYVFCRRTCLLVTVSCSNVQCHLCLSAVCSDLWHIFWLLLLPWAITLKSHDFVYYVYRTCLLMIVSFEYHAKKLAQILQNIVSRFLMVNRIRSYAYYKLNNFILNLCINLYIGLNVWP